MGEVVSFHPGKEFKTCEKNMDAHAFRMDIIRPALKVTDLWSQSAENLMLGTALAESNLDVVKQMGGGPALSFFQIEPNTYNDVIRYLNLARNKRLRESILAACYTDLFPEASCLAWNMRLATLIARVKYWMKAESLPPPGDIEGLANYWLVHYNAGGKGTVEHFIQAWRERA